MTVDEIIKNYTHFITDENQNKWEVVEVSDLYDIISKCLERNYFTDANGLLLTNGDKVELEIVGLGKGEAEIKMCVFQNSQGFLPLDELSDGIRLERV